MDAKKWSGMVRIHQEPRRMWKRYAKTNPVFVWMVVKEYVERRAHKAWRREHELNIKTKGI